MFNEICLIIASLVDNRRGLEYKEAYMIVIVDTDV